MECEGNSGGLALVLCLQKNAGDDKNHEQPQTCELSMPSLDSVVFKYIT